MTSFLTALPQRCLLAITGADAAGFLNGLLTLNCTALKADEARYGCLLSPQGKYLHGMFVLAQQDALYLDVDAPALSTLQQRLTLYKLRAKVVIQPCPDMRVYAAWGAPPAKLPDEALCLKDSRLPAMGWRVYSQTPLEPTAQASEYEAMRLRHTVPDEADFTVDKTLLLDFNLDRLGVVDYTKGCYVGQEVTARMHYRANLRYGVYAITAATPLPPAPASITTAGRSEVGVMTSGNAQHGIARLKLEAADKPLEAGGVEVFAQLPGWRA